MRILAKVRLRLKVSFRALLQFEDSFSRSPFKLSFSQSGEDIIVWFLLQHLKIQHPTYVDIGAHHPEYLSNTALFYLLGSRGINIEPDPRLFAKFTKSRSEDINLNIGIAASSGSMIFYRMTDPALSTLSAAEASRMSSEEGISISERFEVPVDTIRNVLQRHQCCPDFLSIDVEGKDLEILESYDFATHRPAVICIETISFSLHGNGVKNSAIPVLLARHGYRMYADTYINTIFVDDARFSSSSESGQNATSECTS